MRSISDVKVGDLVRRAPKRGWTRSGRPLGRVTELIEVNGRPWARVSSTRSYVGDLEPRATETSAWPVKLLEVMNETKED